MFANRINEVLASKGSEKINIICHSKGGMGARTVAQQPCFGEKSASIICVATPHGRSRMVDALLKLLKRLFGIVGFFVDKWIKLIGDTHPSFKQVCIEFSTEHMDKFNEKTPDVDDIYYKSYACVQKTRWRISAYG